MITPDINYLAVLVAAVAGMIVGALWYSPLLFGKIWMKASKLSEKDMKKAHMGRAYALAFLGSLVTAYVLAHFVDYLEVSTVGGALTAAFWIWLGFFVTTSLSSVLWEGKPWSLYVLNIAHYLVSLSVMAVILGLWA